MPDSIYMQRAIELAASGGGWVNPNPQVGAVLVSGGHVVSEGYHERFGGLHAERNALAAAKAAGASTEGTTMYVTLEPCCHHGKTPPCTDAIIEAGIARVVVGSHDPNPEVAGKGISQLRSTGIEVVEGFMQQECDRLNQIFFHYIKTGIPYVLMKYAMTMDGKIATHTGASKWITGAAAREDVHRLRGRYAAIMVGIGTVLADDPLLNCRSAGGHQPLRIICDSQLRIPLESQIVQTASAYETLIVASANYANFNSNIELQPFSEMEPPKQAKAEAAFATTPEAAQHMAKAAQLAEQGCRVIYVPSQNEGNAHTHARIDLVRLMKHLGNNQIDSVFIEGGPTLNASALEAGCVNRIRCYMAPKLFGGTQAPSPVAGTGVDTPDAASHLINTSVEKFGDDYCIEGEVCSNATEDNAAT